MAIDPLLLLSGSELGRRIQAGAVTSRRVVETHIAHIRRVNPALNAVVAERFAEALREADAADAQRAAGIPGGAFRGVPCTIKESFAFAGMPNTAGVVARRAHTVTEDGTPVARLRAAGCVALGVTNTSEGCMWIESDNRVYGRSNNPYDQAHGVGGSSGGEGAIIGAGGSPFGLAADVGGSIRLPAFFNGVFGHKPSGGLVPTTGQWPIAENQARRYLSTGPIARRAEDLWPLLELLAGPDGLDDAVDPLPLGDPAAVDFSRVRVLDVVDDGVTPVSRELKDAQQRAAAALASRGADVVPTKIPGLRASRDIWSAMLSAASTTAFAEILGNGVAIKPGRELWRWIFRRSPHTLPALMLALLEKLPGLLGARVERALADGFALRSELAALLGDDGIMLYPSFTRTVPRHVRALWPPFDWAYTAIMNTMEVPVTQVPLGLDSEAHLPLGVQVIARRGNDHLTIATAMALEQSFGGWVPPPIMR